MALVFSLWWLYFIIPFDKILKKERERHDLFVFGYGHFFIFAALAGLGSMLNLVTESAATDATHGTIDNLVTQPYAMGMLMSILSVFLFTLSVLREVMCKKSSRNILAIIVALAITASSYFAVAQGVSIAIGIWCSILAPLTMIWLFSLDNKHWLA